MLPAGSHNSFSFCLDVDSDLTPDLSPAIRALAKLFGKYAKDIVYRWSVTQRHSFTAQLTAGIRYFDLRVGCTAATDDFYFMHGLHAGRVEQSLADIKTFLRAHPREIIMLDFNHFYSMSEFQHKQCLGMLLEELGPILCPFCDVKNVTLNMMWENKQQVIVFYHSDIVADYEQFWQGKYMPSPWADTSNIHHLIDFLDKNYCEGRSADTFYVTQGILTPDNEFVFEHLQSSLHDSLGCKVAPVFVDWIKRKQSGIKGLNICIMDFAEMAHYIPAVLALNDPHFDICATVSHKGDAHVVG